MSGTIAGPVVEEHWPLVGRRRELEHAVAGLRSSGSAGLAIHGPAGVGRSRFAVELVAELSAAAPDLGARRVVRIVASQSVGSIPLGSLVHLLPPGALTADAVDAPIDPVRVLAVARDALVGDGPLLLVVDDAHLLDAVSLTLLHLLAQEESVQLVVTVRSGEPEPDGLAALWRTGHIERLDLAPLGAESADTMLHLGLAGPVDGRAARTLVTAGGGLPLMLREVVRAAIDEGSLHVVEGVWRLDGPLPVARRAVELVAGRLAALDDPARRLLELLVLVGETPLEIVEDAVVEADLEQLERDGWLTVRAGAHPGDDLVVAVSRHVVTEAVRAGLSPLRSRNVLRAHAERYEHLARRTPEDELQIAGWRLSAGVPGDPEMLEKAATLARHAEDYAATVRFAEAADRAGGTLRSAVLWADALYELCEWERCEEVFAGAADRPGNAFDRLRLVSSRGTNLLFGLMRGDEALALTREALAEVEAGQARWTAGLDDGERDTVRTDLVSRVALLQMYSGDPAGALDTLGASPPPVPEGDDAQLVVRDALRSRVLWAIPGVPALATSGRTGEAVALGQEAFAEHARLGGEVGFSSVGIHLVTLGLALQEHGDLDQARAVSGAGYDATLASGGQLGQIWFGLNLARIGLLANQPETARRWVREVLAATGANRWLGPRTMALSGMAAASALLGDVATAERCLAEAGSIGDGFRFLFPERALGRAWILAADGRLDDARAVLGDAAEQARATGHLTVESWLRFEAVRLGSSTESVRLAELAAASDSPMLAARAGYATAIDARDATALETAAEQLESLGCTLAAAELFGAAAEQLRADALPRAANAMVLRAEAAVARSEGARSHRLHLVDTVVPLTAREREVAGLAAAGVPSKEIAERLFLSVRTVNNHLQNVYTKLGVSSRAEVAAILGESSAGPTAR